LLDIGVFGAEEEKRADDLLVVLGADEDDDALGLEQIAKMLGCVEDAL